MTDKNGKSVFVGARCAFYVETQERWVEGTVRAVATTGHWANHAQVDDGDPNNHNLHTNGFHVAAWVPLSEIEIRQEPTP